MEISRGWYYYLHDCLIEAKQCLEFAKEFLSNQKDFDLEKQALCFKRLGIVYWKLGGEYWEDKKYSFQSFLSSASLNSFDGENFDYLGRFYDEISNDFPRAEKCYLKSLQLIPWNARVGKRLSHLYFEQGNLKRRTDLWFEMIHLSDTLMEKEIPNVQLPTWAYEFIIYKYLKEKNEQVIPYYHKLLRLEPRNSSAWIKMGFIYMNFEKYVAAEKSYLKAFHLREPCENGSISTLNYELARVNWHLGNYEKAYEFLRSYLNDFKWTKEEKERLWNPFYSLGGNLLLKLMKKAYIEGLFGKAAEICAEGLALMKKCLQNQTNVIHFQHFHPILYKLLGDFYSWSYQYSDETRQKIFLNDTDSSMFLKHGKEAYANAIQMTQNSEEKSKFYYDLGVISSYQLLNQLKRRNYILDGTRNVIESEKIDTAFKKSIELNDKNLLAWNAFALFQSNEILQHYAWIESLSCESNEEAWFQLAIIYKRKKQLGKKK